MKNKQTLCTAPNVLSLARLAMIPLIVWLYCMREAHLLTALVLTVSALTDIADGYIARKYHLVSDLGKALDPIADKLTQAVMLICLLFRFPVLRILVILMAGKELFMGVSGLMVLRRTGRVEGAKWHGKLNTCCLYALMVTHLLWPGIPAGISSLMTGLCAGMMLFSLFLYSLQNILLLRHEKEV